LRKRSTMPLVAMLLDVTKRLLVGRPMQSEHLSHTLLPKRIALPVFASDALSSVAYATEEILLVLSVGGLALLHYTPYIGAAVAVLMLVVVTSYRQNVHAYPSGGGDYEVATTNLGPKIGLAVASALMVDYTLTVAVSVSAGVANLASAFPGLQPHVAVISVAVVAVIAIMNLRGIRESGTAFAIPTYCFIGVVALMIVWGLVQVALGHPPHAESANLHVTAHSSFTGLLLVFVLLKAFSSGCTALTGVEAISNGVPSFRVPKSKNAATTLALLGGIAVCLFAGVTTLALISHVHVLPPPHTQRTVIAQVGRAVFGDSSPLFYALQFVTAVILVLAANTAFNGFPVLASILAKDGYLPRQLRNRGDRLAFSNGILLLSGFAILLIVVFNASPSRLIQLYIIGVFVSFVCSQTGMIRHWNRLLRTATELKARAHMKRIRVINTIGACFTGVVLVIVLTTKFASGAWIVVVAMPAIWLTMRGISRHYAAVAEELAPASGQVITLPARNRAIVLVSKLHLPTLRALAYARATQPSHIEAVTVNIDEADTARLREEWENAQISVPLTVIASPYRDIARPVLAYVSRVRRDSPRDVVTVFIPEYVVGHWWEQLLHNQSALRLKARLLLQPGVIMASVPYQLQSAQRSEREKIAAPASSVDLSWVDGASQARVDGDRGGGLGARLREIAAGHEHLQAEELKAHAASLRAKPIADSSDRQPTVAAGTLRAVTMRPRGNSPALQADLWDGTGSVTLVWLGRRNIPGVEPGRKILVRGRVANIRGVRTMFNPSYELGPPTSPDSTESPTVNR
jgi:amino acid transporter